MNDWTRLLLNEKRYIALFGYLWILPEDIQKNMHPDFNNCFQKLLFSKAVTGAKAGWLDDLDAQDERDHLTYWPPPT